MFLVNVMHAFVLFLSDATRSFVLLAVCKSLVIIVGVLDHPLVMDIEDDHTVSASRVYRNYDLEMFGMNFLIDRFPIPLREACVIVGVDSLNRFRDMINNDHHLVRVRTPSEGELVIHGKAA